MRKINSNIKQLADQFFKAYDIRGIYPNELNEKIVLNIGRAFVLFLKKKIKKKQFKIVVSSDFRLSSPSLKKSFIKGLLIENVKVIDIGFSTTPMNYFAINYFKADAGAMITASHNPKQHNGIKLSLKKAIPIGENSGLKEIKNIFLKNYELRVKNYKFYKGELIKKNLIDEYANFLLKQSQFSGAKNKKFIVIDCGNGATGYVLPNILKKIKIKYHPLYFQPNGEFPNRDPNPLSKKALIKLKKEVLKTRADLGVAFDADGDRVFFVNEKGNLIKPDSIFGLLISNLIKIRRFKKIIVAGDIRLTKGIKEFVIKNKGIFKFSKVGHVFFKSLMRKNNIDIGGETSGHYYFKEFFFCDSGILTMLKILKILFESNKKISILVKPFEKYCQSGEINFKTENKERLIKNIENYFKNLKIKNLKIFNFDGLNIETRNFWFNLRPSNTEPLLRLNLEATTKKILVKKLNLLTKLIKMN